MNFICRFIDNNINLEYDISYYVKQSNEDLISYNYLDNFDKINYVKDYLYNYFYYKNNNILFEYHDDNIIFIYNNHKCIIKSKIWPDNSLYWILEIKH